MPPWLESHSLPRPTSSDRLTDSLAVEIPSLGPCKSTTMLSSIPHYDWRHPGIAVHSRASAQAHVYGCNSREPVYSYRIDVSQYSGSGAGIVRTDRKLLCRSAALPRTGLYKNATYRENAPPHRNHSSPPACLMTAQLKPLQAL